MTTLLIALGSALGFIVAYHTYGRWLARKIFAIDAAATVPSVALNDDQDFVPTSRSIVFGHHFTSIAGTGPIVGPALAIIWGWVPALLWVLFGSIFIGAVHDFGSLIVSMRNRGQTVGEIAGRVLNPRVRFLFLAILLFGLWVVLAIFGWVIARVFVQFPESILPVFLQIPIAVWIGVYVHRKGKSLFFASAIALALMYLTVWFGAGCPGMTWTGGWLGGGIQTLNKHLAAWPIAAWVAVLLAYCYAASVMPVWVLLQPRDYINSLQLISSLALVVVGLAVAATLGSGGAPLEFVAPAWRTAIPDDPRPIVPLMFVTIACGAISGFHCLVSSGTSSKQLKSETDAQFVGYGSMLMEGFLATLVIIAVGAGIGFGWGQQYPGLTGAELWNTMFATWDGAAKNAIGAFVVGAANLLESMGIDRTMAKAIMGVLVASFAGTTLDTATRLQRYVVQEIAGNLLPKSAPVNTLTANPISWLANKHGATLFAVTSAFILAILPGPGRAWSWENLGTGGLLLWPLFGATNQLLAGFAFLVITFWLWRRQKPVWFIVLPTIFMLIMPAWAMLVELQTWWAKGSYALIGIAVVTLLLEAWMIVEALLMWPQARGVLEETLPPLPQATAASIQVATE